jgi:hypothetical protein
VSEIQQSLIGYAVLRANYNAKAPSFLDNFRGFVLDAVAESAQTGSGSTNLSRVIADRFGIAIPSLVVKRLVKRAVSAKYVEGNEKSGYRLTDRGAREAPRISEQITQFRREQSELVSKFRLFLDTASPEHASDSDQDLTEQLSTYFQVHSVALLSQAIRGDKGNSTHTDPGFDYLISNFVAQLSRTDQVAFGYVESAAKGAILASTVSMDTSSLDQSLNKLTIALDTPVMIDLLGWHGEAGELATTQLVALAKALGARVVAFEHSVRELDGVLSNAENALRPSRGNRRSTTRIEAHFIQNGFRPADLLSLRTRLEEDLKSRDVQIIEKPGDYMTYGLDESELSARLDSAIGYRSVGTLNYDVDSLSAIHRMRKGHAATQIERLNAVMVTTNTDVARVSRDFAREESGWPLAVTDFMLAASLWVRRPDAAESLPKAQLIATAYAGMQPAAHLWGAYLDEIDRLVASGTMSEEDAVIFRSGPEPRRALMEVTLGEEEELDEESIQDVIERVRGEYRRPSEERAQQAEAQAASASTATDSITQDWLEAEREKTSLREQVTALEARRVELEEQAEAKTLAAREKRSEIQQDAARSARRLLGILVFIVSLVFVAAGVVSTFFPATFPKDLLWLRIPCMVAGFIVAALGILQIFIPGTVLEWTKPLETRIADKIAARRIRDMSF